MLQITIQNDDTLQITDEFKTKISEYVANYVSLNRDKVVTIENNENNYVISINT